MEIPAIPPHATERVAELADLVRHLDRPINEPGAQCLSPVVLEGPAGVGKTVLASMAVRDERVLNRYSGGIFWLHAGLRTTSEDIIGRHVLTRLAPRSNEQTEITRTCLTLIVVDDVWEAEQLSGFRQGRGVVDTRFLITTRVHGLRFGFQPKENVVTLLPLSIEDTLLYATHLLGDEAPDTGTEEHNSLRQALLSTDGLPEAVSCLCSLATRPGGMAWTQLAHGAATAILGADPVMAERLFRRGVHYSQTQVPRMRDLQPTPILLGRLAVLAEGELLSAWKLSVLWGCSEQLAMMQVERLCWHVFATDQHGQPRMGRLQLAYLQQLGSAHDVVEVADRLSEARKFDLHHAAAYGDAAAVAGLSQSMDANRRDSKGQTPVHRATICGNVNTLEALLPVDGVLVNAQDRYGCTPLHAAVLMGHTDIVRVLLNSDQVEDAVRDYNGDTALHYAVKMGNASIVSAFVEQESTCLSATNNLGRTPLHIAMEAGVVQVLDMLLSHAQVDVNAVDKGGHTPLHVACVAVSTASDLRPASTPRSSAQADATDLGVPADVQRHARQNYETPNRNEALTRLLQHPDVDVSMHNERGDTAFHIACQSGHEHAVDSLLALCTGSIDVNAQNENGNTVLHLACQYGKRSVVDRLLQQLAERLDVNVPNKNGDTALHLACKFDHDKAIFTLLSQCAKSVDVNAQNTRGDTPLHVACQKESPELVHMLLREQSEYINVNVQNAAGNTPWQVACASWCTVANGLLKGRKHTAILVHLLGHSATVFDPRVRTSQGETLLHLIAQLWQETRSLSEAWTRAAESLVRADPELLTVLDHDNNMPLTMLRNSPILRIVDDLDLPAHADYLRLMPPCSLKVHLCGPGGSGKSTLRASLLGDAHSLSVLGEGQYSLEGYLKSRTLGAEVHTFSPTYASMRESFTQPPSLPASPATMRRPNLRSRFARAVLRRRLDHRPRPSSDELQPDRPSVDFASLRLPELYLFDHGGQHEFHVMHRSVMSTEHPCIVLIVLPTSFRQGHEGPLPADQQAQELTEWKRSVRQQLHYWLSFAYARAHPYSVIAVVCVRRCVHMTDPVSGNVRCMPTDGRFRELESLLRVHRQSRHKAEDPVYPLPRVYNELLDVPFASDEASDRFSAQDSTAVDAFLCDAGAELYSHVRQPKLCEDTIAIVHGLSSQGTTVCLMNEFAQRVVDTFPGLQQSHATALARYLEGAGVVMCIMPREEIGVNSTLRQQQDADLSKKAAPTQAAASGWLISNPHRFCSDCLGQLFATDELLEARQQVLRVGSPDAHGYRAHYMLTIQRLNALVLVEDARTGQLRSAADVLFGGNQEALVQVLQEMGLIAADGDDVHVGASDANEPTEPAEYVVGNEAAWLPLYQLADVLLPDEPLRAALEPQPGSEEVWVRVGRRLQRSTDSFKAVLPDSFPRAQCHLLRTYRESRGAYGGFDFTLWHDATLMESRPPYPPTRVLVRTVHTVHGIEALDVYVMGILDSEADLRALVQTAAFHPCTSTYADTPMASPSRLSMQDRDPPTFHRLRLLADGVASLVSDAVCFGTTADNLGMALVQLDMDATPLADLIEAEQVHPLTREELRAASANDSVSALLHADGCVVKGDVAASLRAIETHRGVHSLLQDEMRCPALAVLEPDTTVKEANGSTIADIQAWISGLLLHRQFKLVFVCERTGQRGEPGYNLRVTREGLRNIGQVLRYGAATLRIAASLLNLTPVPGVLSNGVAAMAGAMTEQHREWLDECIPFTEHVICALDGDVPSVETLNDLPEGITAAVPRALQGDAYEGLFALLSTADEGLKRGAKYPTDTGLERVTVQGEVIWVHPSVAPQYRAQGDKSTPADLGGSSIGADADTGVEESKQFEAPVERQPENESTGDVPRDERPESEPESVSVSASVDSDDDDKRWVHDALRGPGDNALLALLPSLQCSFGELRDTVRDIRGQFHKRGDATECMALLTAFLVEHGLPETIEDGSAGGAGTWPGASSAARRLLSLRKVASGHYKFLIDVEMDGVERFEWLRYSECQRLRRQLLAAGHPEPSGHVFPEREFVLRASGKRTQAEAQAPLLREYFAAWVQDPAVASHSQVQACFGETQARHGDV